MRDEWERDAYQEVMVNLYLYELYCLLAVYILHVRTSC